MTRAEVTEIFAVLMMAYPNAEMFKAPDKDSLKAKLAPTITLWTTCLRDIDFWAAQQAVIRVCQTCKFPPTVAEMREAAGAVLHEVFEMECFEQTYETMLRKNPIGLPGSTAGQRQITE